jgi:predicted outer membrane repeat protein
MYAVDRVKIDVKNSVFFNNSASKSPSLDNSGKGGAIFYSCAYTLCSFEISLNCLFEKNSADVSGGALYFDEKPFDTSEGSNIFLDNTAVYGPNIAAYPIKLQVMRKVHPSIYQEYVMKKDSVLNTNYSQYEAKQQISQSGRLLQAGDLETIASGQVITPPPVIAIMDEFDQIVASDFSR